MVAGDISIIYRGIVLYTRDHRQRMHHRLISRCRLQSPANSFASGMRRLTPERRLLLPSFAVRPALRHVHAREAGCKGCVWVQVAGAGSTKSTMNCTGVQHPYTARVPEVSFSSDLRPYRFLYNNSNQNTSS